MRQAPGYEVKDKESGEVLFLKLQNSLYGLSQSSRNWNSTMHQELVQFGFKATISDPFIYVHGSGSNYAIMILHVDDLLVTSPSVNTT